MKKFGRQLFRSFGQPEEGLWFGFGFQDKDGVKFDEINRSFEFLSFVYIIQGEGRLLVDDYDIPLHSGMCFKRIPGIIHSTIIDPESSWKECYIDISLALYKQTVKMNLFFEKPYVTPPVYNCSENFVMLLDRLENTEDKNLPDLFIETLQFLRFLSDIQEKKEIRNKDDYMITSSIADFNMKLTERFKIPDYCRKKGWGYEKFRKLFKDKTGLSPHKYLIKSRIEQSCQLLRSTNYNIKYIAGLLGYKDQYEYSSQFKQVLRLSPGQFRLSKTSKLSDNLKI